MYSLSSCTHRSTKLIGELMKESFEDVYTYASQALDMIEREKDTNPNYEEIKKLLTDQVNEELHDVTYSRVITISGK